MSQLPVEPDAITRKRLALVRQIYLRALVDAASKYSRVARLIGLIGFDLAIETALKATASSLNPGKQPADSFQGALHQVESGLSARGVVLPHRVEMLHVHTLRNDAQHKARVPSSNDVSDCRTYARDALEDLFEVVWNMPFKRMKMGDVVQNSHIRDLLDTAQDALESGQLVTSVERTGEAMALSILAVKTAVIGREPHMQKGILTTDSRGNPKEDRDILRSFRRMQESVLFLAMGLDYASYAQFKGVAGTTMRGAAGNFLHQELKEDVTEEEAEWALSYAIDAISQIEERVGALDRPYGSEYWY